MRALYLISEDEIKELGISKDKLLGRIFDYVTVEDVIGRLDEEKAEYFEKDLDNIIDDYWSRNDALDEAVDFVNYEFQKYGKK
jgi:hypothetical protein